ncbi:MAG: hypothetical protein IKS18_01650 [Lachnospiraceae bacterium]|nr:hypothetical protein [Lachnospiraceae bacterium]
MALLTHDYYCPKIGMASELHLLVPDEILRGEEQAAGILDPSIRPQGYFTESRLTDLFGTEEERIEKREAFFSACGASETRKVFLFSEEDDLGFESTKKAAEIFGNRAVLRLSDSPITLKACSDALGKFVEYWIGGTC